MNGQAKKGGERGVNGEWYDGGQFLPSNETTVKGAYKPTIRKGTKKPIAPYTWGEAPADDMLSIFDRIEHFVLDNRRECQYVKGQGFVGLKLTPCKKLMTSYKGEFMGDDFYQFISGLCDLFNAGERWYPLVSDPFHYKNQ